MIIGGLEDSNPPITAKGALLMEKQKNGELSRMFGYAGNYHVLTVLGCILSGISTILSMLPFVCIWLVIRDLIQAFAAGDISLATESTRYAWMAVVFAAASILIYFIALNCTHLAAFRTATNMRKTAIHHIVTLPLGYFSQNASGRLRKIIDDNAGLTEGFLAHQLPDLTGAVVMPVAVIVLIFLFDWRLGICCLIPMGISVIFLKQMMGGDNAQFMGKYMTALETIHPSSIKYREKQVWMTINNGNSLIGSRVEYDYHAVQRGTLQHEIFENNSIEVWDIDESIELKINCRGCASENNPEMLIPYALFATFEMAPDCGVEVYQKVVTKVQTKNAIKTM